MNIVDIITRILPAGIVHACISLGNCVSLPDR